MNPDAGDGTGTAVSWLVSAMLTRPKSDWNALLKCAAWFVPSSCTSSLLTTSPLGPNTSSNSVERDDGCVCAAAGAAMTRPQAQSARARMNMNVSCTNEGCLLCRSEADGFDQPRASAPPHRHRRQRFGAQPLAVDGHELVAAAKRHRPCAALDGNARADDVDVDAARMLKLAADRL